MSMTEDRARELLGSWITADGNLYVCSSGYVSVDQIQCEIDVAHIEPDILEAIAWWMRNKLEW